MTTNDQRRDPIRLGIIGTGLAVEKLHWPALSRMPERFQVVAFANRSRPNAERFAADSDTAMTAYTADYQALLRREDVEAVLVSLPIHLSLPVSADALAAGMHVICEKPAGANESEGNAFVELAARYPDRVLLIAENAFYRDTPRLARSLLDAGQIDRVHLVAWRNIVPLVSLPGEFSGTPWRHNPAYDGGPHLDAGVHDIAQLRLLLGDIDRLSGEIQDANAAFGGPSDLTLNLRFVCGAVGHYTASYPEFAGPPEPNHLRLYGTEGVMTVTWDTVHIHRRDGTAETHHVHQPDAGYYNEFLDFHTSITTGVPVVGTVTQSFRTMQVILRGLKSAQKGQVIAIDAWPERLSATAVPLWRPTDSDDLFAGLGTTITREVSKSA